MFPRDYFSSDYFASDYWFGDGDGAPAAPEEEVEEAARLDLWGGWMAMPTWWRLRKEDEEWIILSG